MDFNAYFRHLSLFRDDIICITIIVTVHYYYYLIERSLVGGKRTTKFETGSYRYLVQYPYCIRSERAR